MKVMWNIRLFKGMQLLPRQVSDGDRRMDVYVKMVLVDDGQPKSYAIKVSPLAKYGMLIQVTKPRAHGSTLLSNQKGNPNIMMIHLEPCTHGELDMFFFEGRRGFIYIQVKKLNSLYFVEPPNPNPSIFPNPKIAHAS